MFDSQHDAGGLTMTRNTPAAVLADVKRAIRNRYAWPGGYPYFVLMADGEALSCDAAKAEWRNIVQSTLTHARDGWGAAGADINWEDNEMYCAHTNAKIECAYPPDE
jgi:hypothetical protein